MRESGTFERELPVLLGGATLVNSLPFFTAKACVSFYWLAGHWVDELSRGLLQSQSNPFWSVLVMSLKSLLFTGQFSSLPFSPLSCHQWRNLEKLGHLSYKMSLTLGLADGLLKVSLTCSPDPCITWELTDRFMLGLVGIMFKFLGKSTSQVVLGTSHYLASRGTSQLAASLNNVKTVRGFR